MLHYRAKILGKDWQSKSLDCDGGGQVVSMLTELESR